MARLRVAEVASHTLAAELLLMHALHCERAWLYGHPEHPLSPEVSALYFHLVAQRAAGTPVQYLTGKQEFWGLEFAVGPGVLIPRPETEHVMEVALERLGPAHAGSKFRHGEPAAALRLADVGTGSGCLAIALARELPEARVWATDISPAALEFARRNAARHDVTDRIEFLESDLLTAFLPGPTAASVAPFDMIVSNPPYIARDAAHQLPRDVREYEPAAALYGGKEGTELYAALIAQSAQLLTPGGLLVLELGYGAAERVMDMLGFAWTRVAVTDDLAGIPRVLAAERT
ncbi:MAG: peptide chain release factor N(5)-glutamine methyltransferase [Acidipila sp.]|nr:peptide chain release factor N(5)-glutamine methyltransferase [Acidipila sp.]